MATRTVHRGTTRNAAQSLSSSDTLIIQGGSPDTPLGGTAIVAGTFGSAGAIVVQGGAAAPPSHPASGGGELLITGC